MNKRHYSIRILAEILKILLDVHVKQKKVFTTTRLKSIRTLGNGVRLRKAKLCKVLLITTIIM